MKLNLHSILTKHLATITFGCALFVGNSVVAQTQAKTYANTWATSASGLPAGTFTNPSNAAVTGTPTTATLQNSAVLNATGVGSGAIEYLQFPSTVPANTPIYIKFSAPSGLLGLNLAGLLGNLSLGTFTGTIVNASTSASPAGQVDAQTNAGGTSSGLVSLLPGIGPDEVGIVSTTAVNGVYVNLSALLGLGASVNLYHAYYYSAATAGTVGCPTAIDYTNGTGAVAGLANLASGLLSTFTNQANAIDGNDATATTVSVSSVLNTAYFTAILNSPAKTGDSIRVLLNNPSAGLLNLSILNNNISIVAYNGNTVVSTVQLSNSSLINLQLLPGSTSVNVITAAIPGGFDRIQLKFGDVNNLGVANVNALLGNGTISLYEMGAIVAAPVLTSSQGNQYAYAGNAYTLQGTSNAAGDPLVWYDASNAVVASGIVLATTPAGDYNYYALSSRDGCTSSSGKANMTLHIVSAPTLNTPVSGVIGAAYTSNVQVTTPATGLPNTPNYTYALASGALPPPLVLNTNGTITGTPTTAGSYNFAVQVADAGNGNAPVGTYNKNIAISATPLPITLVSGSFIAKPVNNSIVLNWTTAMENNNSGFYVEKSSDSKTFSSVGFVKSQAANGNSNSLINYAFTDNNPANGVNYYRLKQVDINNTSTYSGTISQTITNLTLKLFPNPAASEITISGAAANAQFVITNVLGQVVKTSSSPNINVASLPAGVYFVQVSSNGGNRVLKFIKQ